MEIPDELIQSMLAQREFKRTSYAELALQHLGDRSLGDSLRSHIRGYKKRNNIHTMLEPIDKLFGDAIVLPPEPILIITDTHAPYQNKRLLMSAFNIARGRGIKTIVHAGDLIDGAAFNTQAKNEAVPPIQTEIEHARSILYTAISYFDKLYILPGNHDAYYFKKQRISFDEFIRITILDNQYGNKVFTTDHDYLYYDSFAIIGHLTNGYDMVAGKVAAQLALKYRKHALVGHDHLHGAIQAENGKYGISIGASFIPGSFAYKAKSYNTFPHSMLGFAIIKDRKIHHFDVNCNERIYE